jgi:hypothetical protein
MPGTSSSTSPIPEPPKGLGASAQCGRLTPVTNAAQAAYGAFPPDQQAEADRFEKLVGALADDPRYSPKLRTCAPHTAFGKDVRTALGEARAAITALATSPTILAVDALLNHVRTFCTAVVTQLEHTLVDILQAIRAQFGTRLFDLLPLREINATGRVGTAEAPTPEAVAWGVVLLVRFATSELDAAGTAAQATLAALRSQRSRSPKSAQRAAARVTDGESEALRLCDTATNLTHHFRDDMLSILRVVAVQGRARP